MNGEPRRHDIVVIGVGSIGERHVRCFQATGRANVAICEIADDVRTRVARKYSVGQAYRDLESVLAASPEAAVVATPAHLHIPMARCLAEAGVHLLIEKPLSVGFNGIEELAQVVAQRNVRVAIAYIYRQHPALRAMREAIQSGRFGRPVQLVATCGQHFPTFRPAYRDIYYRDRWTGGGAVQDALPHVLNAGEWLVGKADSVAADVAHQVLDGVDVEDTVHLLARHGDVLASYTLNQYQAPNETTITVVCDQGTCRFEWHRHRWVSMREPNSSWQVELTVELERDDLFRAQANAFFDFLEGRTEPACNLQDALATLRTVHAALASAEERTWKGTGNG